ncbi:hypothetical protein YC2023_107826 [Brassica napus]
MFIGGATKADVEVMREEADVAALARKERKSKSTSQTPTYVGAHPVIYTNYPNIVIVSR